MKRISLLVMMMLALSSVVFGQPRKTSGGKTQPVMWRTVHINKWGVESFSLPV